MKNIYKLLQFLISSIRLVPHGFILIFNKNRNVILYDVSVWLRIMNINKGVHSGFFWLMTFYPEFRNLFYYRAGYLSNIISFLCPKMSHLYIITPCIGPGLFIQHGFSTIIAGKIIGKNCWINQQVTIGYSNATDCPTIGDNVVVHAGAKIIGDISIGNNSKVGANAVVVKSVPPNCTVVGVPAYIIKKDGKKIKISL